MFNTPQTRVAWLLCECVCGSLHILKWEAVVSNLLCLRVGMCVEVLENVTVNGGLQHCSQKAHRLLLTN